MNQPNAAERFESLKAGIIGAIATVSGYGLLHGPVYAIGYQWAGLQHLWEDWLTTDWIAGAIVCLTGFLFGVTYRYIVRQDANAQLKMGAVMAFGLVRGLAQVEMGIGQSESLWLLGLRVLESLLFFAIAVFGLEFAMRQGWIKSFGAF